MSNMGFFLTDTVVKLKNLKLLDLRHNKMKEVPFSCLNVQKCRCVKLTYYSSIANQGIQ